MLDQYFSILDFASGFHQIGIVPKDISKATFSVGNGHYKFIRILFIKMPPPLFNGLWTTSYLASKIKDVWWTWMTLWYYRRVIPSFVKISKPLIPLLQKDTPLFFNIDCKSSFNELTLALIFYPILTYPNLEEPFLHRH